MVSDYLKPGSGDNMRLLALISMAILTGCASLDDPDGRTQFLPSASTTLKGDLAPRQLSVGECGLFVWSGDFARNFILFSNSRNNEGAWVSENGEERLTLVATDGVPTQGQYPETVYTTSSGKRLSLSLHRAQSITRGTRYKSGTLTETTPEGWDEIKPVVGLSACL